MGLDATIKRADGLPLGTITAVQQALSSIFTGLILTRSPSGTEKIQKMTAQGIQIPDFIREHLAQTPPQYEGGYDGHNFSVEFYSNASEPVTEVHLVLRGATAAAEPLVALVEQRLGWITTFP